MGNPSPSYPIAFGLGKNEPVREWLVNDLGQPDRQAVGMDLKAVEYGWPVGMPLCRRITSEKGLWEVRSPISSGRIARVLLIVHDGKMILLHGFIARQFSERGRHS